MASPSPSISAASFDDGHLVQVEILPPSSSLSSSAGSSCSSLHLNLAFPPSVSRAHVFGFCDGRATQSLARPVHPSVSSSSSYSDPTLAPGDEGRKWTTLQNFRYHGQIDGGSVEIRLMREEELRDTSKLLSQSFADTMGMPRQQVRFLEYWVQQYLVKKRALLPHVAVLVAICQEAGREALQLAGMAEVSFDRAGANPSPPPPFPPTGDVPYICNMTVVKTLRRKHIGWHLLGACEALVLQICGPTEVYLHCRLGDKAPSKMYAKAGYGVVRTDSRLVWLSFQQRKRLMSKFVRSTHS